ncbi:MAG: MFS transporter [Gammaproteobacteria bacterium]|nr:MFS transporter [Gammaproteobacteria bacterium]
MRHPWRVSLKAKPDGEVARILLAFLATAGIFYINIMPAIVDGLKEGLAFSNKEAGLVASANTYGAALGAFLVVFFVKGINWRKASYTLLVILISVDLMCMYLTNANTMIAVRFMYGLCGGALVGIGFSVMSRTSEVSRTFGYLLTIQFGLGGVGIIYLPDLVPVFGTKALFLSLAAFGIVTMIMVPFLSDYPARQAANRKVAGLIPSVPAVLALIATFLFQAANMAIYAYSIGIGKFAGLDPSFVSTSLGVGAWIAIGGSVLVIIMSTRLGRLKPVSIAILLTAISTWALHYSHVNPDNWFSSVFWLANVVIAITWAFTISYLLSMCAEFDRTGQMAALGGFASKMGLASGPFFAAYVVGENNYALIITAATVGLIICMVAAVTPSRVLDAAEKR